MVLKCLLAMSSLADHFKENLIKQKKLLQKTLKLKLKGNLFGIRLNYYCNVFT